MPEPEYIKKLIKVDFTQTELLELGMKLTDLIRQLKSFEIQKIAAAADFTSRIKQSNLQIDDTMQKLDNGFEMRHEECLVEYDHDLNMVHYIFENDGRRIIVEQRKMTADEKQIGLNLNFETSDEDLAESSAGPSPVDNIFDTTEAPGFE